MTQQTALSNNLLLYMPRNLIIIEDIMACAIRPYGCSTITCRRCQHMATNQQRLSKALVIYAQLWWRRWGGAMSRKGRLFLHLIVTSSPKLRSSDGYWFRLLASCCSLSKMNSGSCSAFTAFDSWSAWNIGAAVVKQSGAAPVGEIWHEELQVTSCTLSNSERGSQLLSLCPALRIMVHAA